jgi:hypothetical protein
MVEWKYPITPKGITMKCVLTNSSLPLAFWICFMLIAINTGFIHFVHYDSQYRLLSPEHYNIDVITQEDYTQLSDQENRPVKLSSGKTLTKWDPLMPSKYKSVNNGSQYVLVTLRGTAPFVRLWYESAVMPIVIVGVVLALLGLKRKRSQEQQEN